MKKSEIRIIESFQKKRKKITKKKNFFKQYYKNFHNSETTQVGKKNIKKVKKVT